MASAGSYGLCQTACNSGAAACYAAAGYVFGTVTTGVGAPAAVAGCNTAQGTCMSACAAKFLTEGAAEAIALALPLIVLAGLTAMFWAADPEDPKPSSNASKKCSNKNSGSCKSSTAQLCSF